MQKIIERLGSLRAGGYFLAIALACSTSGLTHAQSGAASNPEDPPGRVARLSYLSGDVGLLPADASDWIEADINRPLTIGDRLSSGNDARAELELGGTTVHIDQQTDVGVLDLDEQLAQIELTQGTLSLTVRHLYHGQSVEIDTPTVALVIDRIGTWRVDIDGNTTRVTDFSGDATVFGENNARRDIRAGRRYRFLDSGLATVTIRDIGGADNFDSWSDRRDRRYARSQSSQYVSDDMVGSEDLDQYGQWQDTSDYGAVWYPDQVATDWAPYRDGHWAYIAPWGWTWVDASPWGYAPYHYGRWAHTRRGWGWIPGPRELRPIYAPALVAFVGSGGWSVGIGTQPVGWFPLGPGEIYNPWYHCRRDYYRRVNVNNIRETRKDSRVDVVKRVDNHYGHWRENRPLRDERYIKPERLRGFSAMPGREFAAGQRAQAHLIKVDKRKLASARVAPHGVSLPAARAERGKPDRVRAGLPTPGFRRGVVARHAPPAHTERRIGTVRNAVAPWLGTARSHVRVLNPHEESPGRPGKNAAGQAAQSPVQRTSNTISNTAIVQQRRGSSGEPRQRKLPSERFAPQREGNISGSHRLRLPQTSNVVPKAAVAGRRLDLSARPAPRNQSTQYFAHPPQPGAIQRQRARLPGVSTARDHAPVVRQVRPRPQFQRPQPTPTSRATVREQPRPQIQRDLPRPVVRQPRQSSPPHAASGRVEASRPQRRSEAKPERKSEPGHHRDGQRQ